MSDVPQANPNGLMSIGAVAAHNIAALLNLDVSHVGTIEQAIKDEIGAMSSHFTLAIADVQTQYESENLKLKTEFDAALAKGIEDFNGRVAEVKSTYKWVDENKSTIVVALSVAFGIGALVGAVLYYVV
jgi:hypothetical protein